MTAIARLEATVLTPDRYLNELIAASPDDGAVVSFVGLARPIDAHDQPIERLFLAHHPRLTEASLHDIAVDALERFGVSNTLVVHRCGAIGPGEAIVFAAAASRHRRAAFEAADYLMDRLKTEALFWKREDTKAGSTWIEPTARDHADLSRWSDRCPE